jgi:hypothetical protein
MTPPMNSVSGAAEVVRGLTEAQRNAILSARIAKPSYSWVLSRNINCPIGPLVDLGIVNLVHLHAPELSILGLHAHTLLLKDQEHV